jgi:hypothetical protein
MHYFVSAGRLLKVVCVAEERAWRASRGPTRATWRSCGRRSTSGTRSSGASTACGSTFLDGPEQEARDAAMASAFGLSPEIGWLYGYDPALAPRRSDA